MSSRKYCLKEPQERPVYKKRRPPVEATKFEHELRLFPSRILRSYRIYCLCFLVKMDALSVFE